MLTALSSRSAEVAAACEQLHRRERELGQAWVRLFVVRAAVSGHPGRFFGRQSERLLVDAARDLADAAWRGSAEMVRSERFTHAHFVRAR